jgi:hypothetical protein
LVSGFGGGVLQAAPVHFAVAQAVAADTYITALVQTALEVVMDL